MLREWERDLRAGRGAQPAPATGATSLRPDWPAPETVRDHRGWEPVRGEVVRRNTLVARGAPDAFPLLPPSGHRGERLASGPGSCASSTRPDIATVTTAPASKSPTSSPPGLLSPGEPLTGRFKGAEYTTVVESDGRRRWSAASRDEWLQCLGSNSTSDTSRDVSAEPNAKRA